MPLESIRDFATARGIGCRTLHRDLLDLDGSEQWDQIVLHYTRLSWSPISMAASFAPLRSHWRPGGRWSAPRTTTTRVVGDHGDELANVYFNYSQKALGESSLSDSAFTPEFIQMLRAYADAWGRRRANLPTGKELRNRLLGAGLNILSESATALKKRFVGDAAIVDSSSIIVAGR